MDKTMKWLKNLMGIKKKQQKPDTRSSSDIKCWISAKSTMDSDISNRISVSKEEKQKAILQIAARKIRRKWRAAVMIQTIFRGFLARRALRALKGLIKLQALVRGYLVRKRIDVAFYGIQALHKAQATVFSKKIVHGDLYKDRLSFEYTERRMKTKTRKKNESSDCNGRFSASSDNKIDTKVIQIHSRTTKLDRRPYRSNSFRFTDVSTHHLHVEDDVIRDKNRASTTQNTPRFLRSVPVTLLESRGHDIFHGRNSNYENYITNILSDKEKRSENVPKHMISDVGSKRGLVKELMESRISVSGIQTRKSCCHVQEALSIKNAVVSKLKRFDELVRVAEKDYQRRRRW